MIYPIVAYGDPVLKRRAQEIDKNYPKLKELIDDMYATMYKSNGVGLAAPQIGLSIRMFITDGAPFSEDDEQTSKFKEVFINPVMLEEYDAKWKFNEGCLSVPGIREDITRCGTIRIKYCDANFVEHEKIFTGIAARIVQHEYDHLEGKLFIDHISPLRRNLLRSKLNDIAKGITDAEYKMKFFKK